MIIFILVSCIVHKTSLTGIVDHTGRESCTIELDTGELVVMKSTVCQNSKEGDIIRFYGKKE